ncbi:hypothetical protein HCG51_11085 [Tolypothrix sp. PCC 7910]|nr:hypothetical protein HCG51_11085 [Tolypothrix sp. PCC 7910]
MVLVKSQKLSPIIRGWRNYHRYCKMDGSRFRLWFTRMRAWSVFNNPLLLPSAENNPKPLCLRLFSTRGFK